MNTAATPAYFDLNEQYAYLIFGHELPAVWLFDTEQKNEQIQAEFKAASGIINGKIPFITAGIHETYGQQAAHLGGIDKKDLPTVVVINPSQEKGITTYKFTGNNKAQGLANFAT